MAGIDRPRFTPSSPLSPSEKFPNGRGFRVYSIYIYRLQSLYRLSEEMVGTGMPIRDEGSAVAQWLSGSDWLRVRLRASVRQKHVRRQIFHTLTDSLDRQP